MHVRYLLAAYAPIENLIQGQDCPARGRERYSADDILRLREAFRAVRLDMNSRCSSIIASISLMTHNIEDVMRDYDFSYADAALFFTRNGFPISGRELRKRLAMAEDAKDTVSAAQ